MDLGWVSSIIDKSMRLLPAGMNSEKAKVMLLAIGLQESGFRVSYQVLDGGIKGPARGYWQFERGSRASKGGVWGVFLHSASHEHLRVVCSALDVRFDPLEIWASLETNDILACCVARLLLLTDPKPLPATDDANAAWECYRRNWRPGKPKPNTWSGFHSRAVSEVVNKNDAV